MVSLDKANERIRELEALRKKRIYYNEAIYKAGTASGKPPPFAVFGVKPPGGPRTTTYCSDWDHFSSELASRGGDACEFALEYIREL